MRRTLRRGAVLGTVAAGLWAFGLVALPGVVAQVRPNQPVFPNGADPTPPKPEAAQTFTFPEDRDAKQRLKAVMDYLDKKAVPWDVVCGTAQQLLDARSDSFYPLDDADGAKGGAGSRVSVKAKVNDLVGKFPKDGRQFYELTYGPAADAKLKEAVQNRYDKPALADVSQRYFHTKAGARATLLLATLDLETGNFPEAAYGFQRLLDRPEADDVVTPRTLFKAAVAFKRSGDPRQADAVSKLWDRLEKTYPRDGLAFGRRTYTLDELKLELARGGDAGVGRGGDQFVMERYGNAAHTGVGDGGTPFLDPSFEYPLIAAADDAGRSGAEWVRGKVDYALAVLDRDRTKGRVAVPGFFPVTAPGMIVFRTYDRVVAVATKDGHAAQGRTFNAGDLLWNTPTQGGAQAIVSTDLSPHNQAQAWWSGYWQAQMPSILFENAQAGSLSHDGRMAYFVDDLAIPPQPQFFNQNMGGFGLPQNPAGAAGLSGQKMVDYNQLIAVHLDTGLEAWRLGGLAAVAPEKDDEKATDVVQATDSAYFLGPPLPLNGKLYALYERNGQTWLGCLDPYHLRPQPDKRLKPELVWSQNLGAPATRLGQDSLRRIQPAYLTYADGVLVCPTNSGAVVAVDVNARSLLWARSYAAAPPAGNAFGGNGMPGMIGGGRVIMRGGGFNPGGVMPGQLPQDRWRAAAPIISGGKVVVTAYDSEQLQCLDLRTGDLLWSAPRQATDLYLGGVMGDKVLVVGKESVRAYALAGGPNKEAAAAWPPVRIGVPCGHGAASRDGLYYVPVAGDPDRKDARDPEVWAVDVATGKVKSKTAFRRKSVTKKEPWAVLGNLVFHEGQLFAQSATDLSAFPLSERKKAEMAERLKANPNDPDGLFARGELSLDDGAVRDAVADFKAAEANRPSDATRRRLREKLFVAYTELFRKNFADGEPHLAEYEALCDLPVDAADPAEKQRLMDERVRRRGLYLSTLAQGREAQGRLVEAFEAYRAYAVLGDNKQLVAAPDDAGGQTRPDVWARGRIDAMVRGAKDPAARRPLDDRVRADWAAVRDANDLPRLREFVAVFGPYFAVGRDAQLLLADRLLATNNEDDGQEAQTRLMQLWATAEDPAVEARAVEALARALTRRGMMEDAVDLYAQLGTTYAAVPVRDGKTGADLFGELVTDKRLLPYLEPGRGPAAGRYKVEAVQAQAMNRAAAAVEVRPDGDLLPFFRRYALLVEPTAFAAGNGEATYQLRVVDRATGEERCKFTGLAGLQPVFNAGAQPGFNPGVRVPPDHLVRASGHLLLLTAGPNAYCLDLAEKRKRWEYNLLGAAPAATNPPEYTADGEVEFTYDDGWKVRLGRSAVLQPTYACLVTHEGLVALDPATGQKLWVRSNVSKRVQVFGDAKYVFVVDGAASRVLRAVDGTPVEGVTDFAALATGPARVGVFDRHVLLSEGGKTAPRTLRLYDPLTGRDVWKKEYPAGSLPLKTVDPNLTGCVTMDGRVEVVAARTGKTLLAGKLDADRLDAHLRNPAGGPVVSPLVLADAERFYLFLNRAQAPNQVAMVRFAGTTTPRAVAVNGAAYAFDRSTGARAWYADTLFENQTVYLERFDDLPVLVAAAGKRNPRTDGRAFVVVVVDKQKMKVQLLDGFPETGPFVAVVTDPKTRTTDFLRHDLRVRVSPDEPGLAGR